MPGIFDYSETSGQRGIFNPSGKKRKKSELESAVDEKASILEGSKQLNDLKSQAKQGPVTIDLGNGKKTEIDEETKKNWFKLNDQAKNALKDKIGQDAFNQLKDQLDKQAPKQSLFNKVTDVVNANSEADKFRRIQQGQNEDYRTAQREAGQKDYTNPFQRVAFSIAEPVARGANTIAGASGKFAQGVSDIAGIAFASDPEEKRIAKERAIARGNEDIAFSGKGGLLGVGANFQNAKELEDKKKLAGAAIQTGADLASAIPQGKAFKLGSAGLTEEATKRLGLKIAALNAGTNVLSEGGNQLKKGNLDVKALAFTGAMGLGQPLAGYTLGKLYSGVKGGVPAKAIDDFAEGAVSKAGKPKIVNGDPFDAAGNPITIGKYQELTQPKALTKMENNINAGGGPQSLVVPGTYLDALPDEGGKIGYKTMASLSGDSKLAHADKALYDNLKYSVKGLGGGKVGQGLEKVARMFDSEQAVNSELKNLEFQGRVAKGTADYTRKNFADYKRSSAAAQQWMEGNENVKTLTGAIRERAKATGGDIRAAQGEVANYIKARSEMELQKLHDATGGKSGRAFDPAKRASLEADLAKYDTPQAQAAFDGMAGAYKDMLKEDFDRGYLSAQEYKNLQDLPYDYTRQQRVVQDWEREASNAGKISSKPGRIQKRAESTSKELLDPLETMMAYSQQREAAHLKNVYKEQVLGALQEGGEAKLVTKGARAEGPEISVRRNGVDEKYQVSPAIAKVLDHTDPTEIGAMANAARAMNNIFKYGTTGGNVGFALRNVFVDLPSAVINSEAGLRVIAPMNLMTSYGKALGVPDKILGKMNKELWQEYKDNVGTGATRIQQYDKPKVASKVARDLVKEGASLREKGINVAKNPGEMGNIISKLDEQIARTEHATRFAVFNATKRKALKKGLSQEAALDLAVQASREATTDFLSGGTGAKKLNMFAPYFNPKMQVARTLGRSFEKRPVSTMMKMSATVGIPMIALTLNNTETPEKRAIYDEISPKTKEDYHIYIADNATYDPTTKKFTGVTTVRKPNDASGWFEGVRKYIEKTAYNDPEQHATWLGALKDTANAVVDNSPVPVTPKQAINSIPGFAKTPLEDYTNKSFYYGGELVPQNVKDSAEAPADQHYTNYSRTSKFLGGLLGKSPLVIDNYIKGNFGEVGTNVQNVLDRVTGGKAGMTNEEGKTYTDIGGRTFGNSLTRGFDAARGGEVQKQFWDTKNNVQHSRDIASKKVTSAVNNGDYTRAERLAQEYNDSIATKLTPFLRKYQDSPSWDPEWDGYLEGLFIKSTPRALKSRVKKS